jgi:hypothetical protein
VKPNILPIAGTAAVVALLALGCGRTGKDSGPAAPGAEVGGSGSLGGGGGPVGGSSPTGIDPEACRAPQPGPSPLRRLDRFELGNTVRAFFEDAPAVATAVEPQLQGLLPSAPWFEPSAPEVEQYHRLAHQAALELTRDPALLQAFAGCDPLDLDEEACRDQLVERALLRAYRRPPTSEELVEMQDVFVVGQGLGGDFASGARALFEVVLQGPDFLYLIEQGEGDAQDGAVALTPYETAARLSYFLTGSPADAELLGAAEARALDESALEAQARRLLGTPANRRVSRRFYEQLFGLESLQYPPDLTSQHPTYTPQIAALSLTETGLFVEDVTFDGAGTFEALLTEPATWVNGPLATFYGIPGVTGDAFQKVQLDPTRRAGILTQSAFLTSTSVGGSTRPVMRGLPVLRKVLCIEPPPPPSTVDVVEPPPPIPEPATTRQRYEAFITGAACLECHRDIDPIGFAFESYDAVGLWRDTENGLPIDASGTLIKTDAQGPFANAIDLLQRIAASEDAHACFVGNWLSYAYGRKEAPEDACARQDLETAFRDSGGNIQELVVALAKTDQLRYRLASELAR